MVPFIVQAAAESKVNPARGFQRGFFAKLVPNTRKLGLARREWRVSTGALGQSQACSSLEFADDTGSDYEAYDAVAADRMASAAD